MQNQHAANAEIGALEAEAARAAQSGKEQEALGLWGQILAIDPNHVRTLTTLGQRAFRQGNAQAARVAFQRVVDTDGSDQQHWINLALACQALQDEKAEEEAITGALRVDPSDLLGLILRGNLFERQGRKHEAARAFGAAATVSPPLEKLNPDLRPAVMHARDYQANYLRDCAKFMDQFLEPYYRQFAGEKLGRFRDSFDLLVARKKRFDSQSMLYHYPSLPAIEFFERADFPWLDAFEEATDEIRTEFLEVLKGEEGFAPYITYADDIPLNQWAELNHSPDWSAFQFYVMGKIVKENADRCPKTMNLLATAPQPDQPGRTPSAMFSLLKPKTKIPPHVGVTNARLVTHLPLIIPEDCGFRVGNETREWVPGRAWVFDDTIDHEAWNNSDKLRVVLIFDIWHPHLTVPERAMITAMNTGMNAFSESAGRFDL